MKSTKINEPVRLRSRMLSNGCESLYLDIYFNGRRSYEFLKLYLVPEKTRADKEANRQTMQLATSVKAKRIVEMRNAEFGFRDGGCGRVLFFEYFTAMARKRREVSINSGNSWENCLKHLHAYESDKSTTMSQITKKWVEGFVAYLWKSRSRMRNLNEDNDGMLSEGTVSLYLAKLNACLNKAVADGIITRNPAKGVLAPKPHDSARMYLTTDEVRRLAATGCKNGDVRRAFLFSCLTGLRLSDIRDLTWDEVSEQGRFTRITFAQKKTGGQEYLDITSQAAELLGSRDGKHGRHVFAIPAGSHVNEIIDGWVKGSGIGKKITFHCARHTFAVMMLDIGTDIYTVSKLLGHRELSTTQIYAKVLDKNKQAAVERIPDIF